MMTTSVKFNENRAKDGGVSYGALNLVNGLDLELFSLLIAFLKLSAPMKFHKNILQDQEPFCS